jgi:hypothetical protein
MSHSHPYEVLEVVRSKSNPDKTYEIRKSHQDGKTYCTCPGWIFKARKTEGGMCKHLLAYVGHATKKGVKVVVMTAKEFLRGKIDYTPAKPAKPDEDTFERSPII